MKKLILTISVIITLIGVLATTLPLILKSTGLDEPLKAYILPKILPQDQGNLDFKSYSVGPGRINFNDVAVVSEDGSYTLNIKSLRISLNLLKLLRYPRTPERALSGMALIEPKLIMQKSARSNKPALPDSGQGNISIKAFLGVLNRIQEISEISIRDGQILLKDSKQRLYVLGNHLNGTLAGVDETKLTLTTDGNLLEGKKKNLYCQAEIDLENQSFRTELKISHHYRYEDSFSFLPSDVQTLEGDIHGNLVLKNSGEDLDSLDISGSIVAENINTTVDSNSIKNLAFILRFNGSYLDILDGHGAFNDHPFSFSGTASNFTKPELKGQLYSGALPLTTLQKYIPVHVVERDQIDVQAELTLSDFEPELTVVVRADSLSSFAPVQVTDISSRLVWKNEHLVLDGLQADLNGTKITGWGDYDINNRLNMRLMASRYFGSHSVFEKLSDRQQQFLIFVNHDFSENITSGGWNYLISGATDTLFTAVGSVWGRDDWLGIKIDTSTVAGFKGNINLRNLYSEPVVENSHILDLPISFFISDANLARPFTTFKSTISLEGTFQNLKGQILLNDRKTDSLRYALYAEVSNLFSSRKQLKGHINLNNMAAYYDFDIKADSIGGRIASPQGFDGSISLDLARGEKLDGLLDFNNFNIVQALESGETNIEDFRLQGIVNGKIRLDGTLHAPRLSADLNGDKFVYNSVGYYQARLHMQIDTSLCQFDSLNLYLNNTLLLTGHGAWRMADGSLDGEVFGKNLVLGQVISTFNPENVILSGLADYHFNLKGTTEYPWIEGNAQIREGEIAGVEFDDLEFALIDKINAEVNILDPKSHTLKVNDLSMNKTGLYHFTANGEIPFSTNKHLGIQADFNGDLLHFLPRVEKFFLKGASLANVRLNIGGTWDEIRLLEGDVIISRGELWLRDVAPHIDNIEGAIKLKHGTNQVDFIDFIGQIDDRKLTINTVRSGEAINNHSLQNWYFKGLDLDFGILALQTSREGVELHIPGLMFEDDTGMLYLNGDDGAPFYFAGPVSHPVAYGNLTLYDTRLTYPFLVNNSPTRKESKAVRFLKTINWDVLVTAGEDVKYLRDIPAYIDNVSTELFVDEVSPGLHFTGILNQGTFRATGRLASSRGRLEYLDQNFKVDRFAIEFNRGEKLPIISGRAWTTIRDSIGAAPKTIYLQLYALDSETGIEKQQGGWEDFKFKLLSADPQIGETQEQVLAYMGFSVNNIKKKATSVGGAVTEKYLIRPLLRPVERVLENSLGMDMVRINSSIARNLFNSSLGLNERNDPNSIGLNPFPVSSSYLMLMQSSEVTVGKYLAQNVFLTYTGQLVSVQNSSELDFGFNHSLGIEYRFFRNVLLEFEYDRELSNLYRYTDQHQYMDDFKIRLRHSFTF